MPTTSAPDKPSRRNIDEITYHSLVRLSVLLDIIGLLSALAVYYLIPKVELNTGFLIAIIILLAIGLIFNIFIWKGWHKSYPRTALQIAILPPIISIQIASIADGGVSSDWYYIWLVAVVCTGVVGVGSSIIASFLTIIFWLYSFLVFGEDMSLDTIFLKLCATIIAIIASYYIGRSSDRAIKTNRYAEGLTRQLDGAQMRTQLMMSAIADVVVGVDSDCNVIIFNEAAQAITRWDKKSAMGINYNLIFKLKDRNNEELTPETDPFLQVLKSGKNLSTDQYSMLDKNDQKISFSITIAPSFDSKNKTNGAIAIFHDISDQKAVARERNEFISTASHEMRTPVAAIEGYLSMAMNPSLATIDERAKTFINKAHNASLHLGKLFRDLLSVTRIEDSQMTINRRKFNFTALLNQVIDEMIIIAKNKNIRITTRYSEDNHGGQMVVAPIYEVIADPDRIREVIANLIDNAIKYSKENTTVDVLLKSDKDNLTFSVTDSGIGISAQEQKHLFQKFYRVNNSITRDVGGTGLGLYIARSLIEEFGGHIKVISQEGKGSTFEFSLPLDKAKSF